jgi:prepilin-type N-terminal cleavage/methylation domain-containing protein
VRPARSEKRSERGFTLVELMLALLIFSFAIAGVLSVAVASTRAFREQRRAIAIETATRAPMDFLVDAIRGSSPAVASGSTIGFGDSCLELTAANVGCTGCFPIKGALMIMDNTSAPDELYTVFAAGGVVKTTYTDVVYNSPYVDLADTTDFEAGDTVMLVSDAMGTMRTVQSVAAGRLTFTTQSSCATPTNAWPSGGYPKGSLLIRVKYGRFTIGTLAGETIPMLMMNGEPVAEGVEDMQLAVGVDTAADGVTDNGSTTDEWIGNASPETIPAGAYTVRALRIVLVARDSTALLGPASFARPAALNRAAGTADNYRRRTLFSTVDVRNLNLNATGTP